MRTRKKYTDEFKREAVRLATASDRSIASVATDLGIDRNVIAAWVRKTQREHYEPTPGKALKTESRGELEQPRRELAKVKVERDILQKGALLLREGPDVRFGRTYGSRRVWRDVLAWGERCGIKRVARLMSGVCLQARRKRRRTPDRRLVDAAVPDRAVGHRALMMATWRRGKPREPLHHSDQGSQYTSEMFQRLLFDQGITCSMSRRGNCWDNAAMESIFSSLKTERVDRKRYQTRDQARAGVFDYIERFDNPRG